MQSLSPEKRQALLQRLKQRRAQKRGAHGGRAKQEPANISDVSIELDLPYGADPLQKLDIYKPRKAAETPFPIVIFVHGGGWSKGDKNQGDRKSKGCAYVAKGIIFISTNYRLAPKAMHPLQVEDVAAALAWVKKHAGEFGGDKNRIYLMGHSAGAHLVDLLGTNDKYLAAAGLSLEDIKGVISLDTASLNLTERKNESSADGAFVGPMIDSAFGKDPAVLKEASPTLSIAAGKSYPPFLMFYGARRASCQQQHKAFETALKKAGGKLSVIPVQLNHSEINLASGEPGSEVYNACMQMILASKNSQPESPGSKSN